MTLSGNVWKDKIHINISDKLQRQQSMCITARHALADILVTPSYFPSQGNLQLLQHLSGACTWLMVTSGPAPHRSHGFPSTLARALCLTTLLLSSLHGVFLDAQGECGLAWTDSGFSQPYGVFLQGGSRQHYTNKLIIPSSVPFENSRIQALLMCNNSTLSAWHVTGQLIVFAMVPKHHCG